MSTSTGSNTFRMAEGDWVCSDLNCANINFARRTHCNRCGAEKSEALNKRKLGHEIGSAAAAKSHGLFSADDWQCAKCANVNWARRQQCNVCNAPRYGEIEERTGLGGGYNDRGTVEYKKRDESDDEYDEFGRRKKRLRKDDSDASSSDNEKEVNDKIVPILANDESHEMDDKKENEKKETKGDAEDEEEEDDEDDDDGDLSKYDLSDWTTDPSGN